MNKERTRSFNGSGGTLTGTVQYYGAGAHTESVSVSVDHPAQAWMKDRAVPRGYNPCKQTVLFTDYDVGSALGFGPIVDVPDRQRVYIPQFWLWDFVFRRYGYSDLSDAMALYRERAKQKQTVDWWKKLRFVSTDPDFDLPVFLAELKECKKMMPGLRQHFKHLRAALQNPNGKFASLGDLVAGGWLDWSFGTGAFVRDLMKMWTLFGETREQVDKFIAGMGHETSTAYGESLGLVPIAREASQTIHLFGQDLVFGTEVGIDPSHVRNPYVSLSATYRYYSQVMTGAYGRTKIIAQKWGLVFNPAIPWNLIPLSFVLDWVIPVGTWLERMRIDLFDLNVVLDGAGFGTRVSLLKHFYVSGVGRPLTNLGYLQMKYYEREALAKLPALVPKELTLGKVTLNKVLSGSSLLWVFNR